MNAAVQKINTQKYKKLVAMALPTVIETEEENDRMLAIVEGLMAKGENMSPEDI